MNVYILFLSIRSNLHTSQIPYWGCCESTGKRVHADSLEQAVEQFMNTSICHQFRSIHKDSPLYLRCHGTYSAEIIDPEYMIS